MAIYRPGLAQLPTYSVDEREWEIKIDANESNVNLPPLVQERLINRLAALPFNRYPDIGMKGLKEQIARNFNLRSEQVLIGNGSSEILEKLFHAYGGSGRSIVFPTPSFSMYGIYAKLSESEAVAVQLEPDYSLDPEKLLAAAGASKARLIVLCSPNNPTGNAMEAQAIEYIVQQAACPVVVDEAYSEFHGQSSVGLLEKYPDLMIARTFSKAYGFAAARVGYLLAASAEAAAVLGRLCMPYHVNALSLAGAEIIFQMRDEFAPCIRQVIAERQRIAAALQAMPEATVYPSDTNFLLVKFMQAAKVAAALAEQGVGVRDFSSVPGLLDCLRITAGTPAENDTVLEIIRQCGKRG